MRFWWKKKKTLLRESLKFQECKLIMVTGRDQDLKKNTRKKRQQTEITIRGDN